MTLRFCAIFLFLAIFLTGCMRIPDVPDDVDAGGFTLEAKYNYIRSVPAGGGIFPVRIVPAEDFAGTVRLSVQADSLLHAELNLEELTEEQSVAALTIRPDTSIQAGMDTIRLTAEHGDSTKTISLEVEIFNWGTGDKEGALAKMDTILQWVITQHPEYREITNQNWFIYATYPQIWVVEHYTLLSDPAAADGGWEVRVCWHVMIPPYNWSKLRIRKLSNFEAEYAAERETDAIFYDIPVSEYPVMFGY